MSVLFCSPDTMRGALGHPWDEVPAHTFSTVLTSSPEDGNSLEIDQGRSWVPDAPLQGVWPDHNLPSKGICRVPYAAGVTPPRIGMLEIQRMKTTPSYGEGLLLASGD